MSELTLTLLGLGLADYVCASLVPPPPPRRMPDTHVDRAAVQQVCAGLADLPPKAPPCTNILLKI